MGRKLDIELTDGMIEDIVAKINDNISLTWEELMEKYNIDYMSKDHFRKMATGIDLLYNHMNDNDSKLMNMEAYEKLLKREIKVNILNIGVMDNTPSSKLIRNIFFSFAEFERDMIIERTKEG